MEKIRNIVSLAVALFALIFMLKCTGPDSPQVEENRAIAQAQDVTCSLVGLWTRCISNGFQSARISFIASSSLITQKTETFLTSPNCSGDADSEDATDMSYHMGEVGKSEFVIGGTDMDFTSNSDLTCGPNKTVYSTIKFTPACNAFFPGLSDPGCVPIDRDMVLDAVPFVRQ
jgi:hypothetical protein